MKRIAVVFGTRPEAIKLAPVVLALREEPGLAADIWSTGQHREMLQQVLDLFGITPDVRLDVMRPDQSLASLTAALVDRLDTAFKERRPDLVVVQGDTTTALCAGLVGFYHRVPVCHVEAGLRTRDLTAPWPEEANRQMLTRVSDLHLVPTGRAKANLLAEAVRPEAVVVTGNTVVDALRMASARVAEIAPAVPGLPEQWADPWPRLVLITGHRRESFGPGFEAICQAIAELAETHPAVRFVYPVHLNPHVRQPVAAILEPASRRFGNIHLIEPLTYLPFVRLMAASTLVLTDSGGVQEEAPSLAKPVLVMRRTTERPEAIEAGVASLVGTDRADIVAGVSRLLRDEARRAAMARAANPFGDGRAAARSVEAMANFLAGRRPLVMSEFRASA